MCKENSTDIPVSAELLITLLSTLHPNGKFLFDYRGVSADALEDIFYQALSKIKQNTLTDKI
jgi:hypothetical protein